MVCATTYAEYVDLVLTCLSMVELNTSGTGFRPVTDWRHQRRYVGTRGSSKNEDELVPKKSHVDLDKLSEGSLLSCNMYFYVKSVGDEITLMNTEGRMSTASPEVLKNDFVDTTAKNSVNLPRTKIVELLQNRHWGHIMQVLYTKKPLRTEGIAKLKSFLTRCEKPTDKEIGSIVEDIQQGRERTITGHVLGRNEETGHIIVRDLEVMFTEENGPSADAIRMVDPRTIKELTIGGTNYVVK